MDKVRDADSGKPQVAVKSQRVVVVDLGKSKRGKVRKLKDGGGPLMGKVQDVITRLTEEKAVTGDEGPATVVFVVERRPRKRLKFFG